MSEEIFELERPFERSELAALFQGFASALTDGQPLTVETDDGLVSMDVPERVATELELEVEGVKGEGEEEEENETDEDHSPPTVEFEIELEWEDASGESIRTDGLVGEDGEHGDSELLDEVESWGRGEGEEKRESASANESESENTDESDSESETKDGAERPSGTSGTNQRRSRFEVYRDAGDEWRWRLVHWNGNIIADSGEGYTTRQSAVNGLESVRHNAPGATVDHQDRR
ncbi:HVO_2922 family protein [Natronoglomus mannanivorans]|uniref:YegP family protein n=1 Tax=Natronoglomus mannanivorans TaxID=2979990 RepID=A0AAP2YXI7_9EURY|nr:YegP family protein [Halobacteria archaeon AArc-xg1-1]